MIRLFGTLILIFAFLSCKSSGSSEDLIPIDKNRQIINSETIEKKDNCIELNDSALVLFMKWNKLDEAITVIDLAIECDSQNLNFVRSKLVILLNGGNYDDCLKYLEKKKNVVGVLEYYTTKADCNFYLKNIGEFENFSGMALQEAENTFVGNKEVSNLIILLSMVKRYKGAGEANKLLETNRNILDEKGLYDVAVGMLDKAPTITDTSTLTHD